MQPRSAGVGTGTPGRERGGSPWAWLWRWLTGSPGAGARSSGRRRPPRRLRPSAGASASTTTTAPLTGEVAVAFPVVACTTSSGAPLASQGMEAHRPAGADPDRPGGQGGVLLGRGAHRARPERLGLLAEPRTARGPPGWWSTLRARPLPRWPSSRPAGTEGIFAIFDNTGTAQGISLVCPYFTVPSWQQTEANCSGIKPAGRTELDAHPGCRVGHRPGRRRRDASKGREETSRSPAR